MVAGSLHEKRGYYHIVLNIVDEYGKRKQKWISTGLPIRGNKKRAEDLLRVERQRYSLISPVKLGRDTLFADYIEKIWLPSKSKIEQITYAEYQHEVEVIAKYFRERRTTMGEMNITVIEDFHDKLRKSLSECTVHKYHVRIHSALRQAVRRGVIPSNPAADVERPKPKKYNASFYNAVEMEKVLEIVKGTKLEIPVMLGFYGLRRSEVIGLKWDAVDFDNNSISINHTVTSYRKDGKRIIEAKPRTKNDSSRRTLPMIPALREKLLQARDERDKWRKLCGKSYSTQYLDYICVNELGELIKPDYITHAFAYTLAKHGLRKVRYHDLRHSCASLLLANGVSMKEIQDWLGHSTFKTTADIYAHLEHDSKLASANALSKGTAFGNM